MLSADNRRTAKVWNRKLHYYLGLYFLFFIWLFALSGLLLNHSTLTLIQSWPTRKVTVEERRIPPLTGAPVEQARALVQQLGMEGEIAWPSTVPAKGPWAFRVTRPREEFDLSVDAVRGVVTIQTTKVNVWGILRGLHTFNGVRRPDATTQRDWVLSKVWAFAMDAIAVGLIVLVLSGICMWYQLKSKRAWGFLAIGFGTGLWVWLVFGLRWIS